MTWNEQGRRAGLAMLAIAVAILVVFLCHAQLLRFGFEACEEHPFDGPYGGGAYGGSGGGHLVTGNAENFIRTGQRAVRLEVWDDGSDESVAWAGVMRTLACDFRRKVQAGVWLYFSSVVSPLQPGASAHVRVEYFEDAEGTQLMPDCVYVSPPFDPETHEPDKWHLVEVKGRIPADSKSLRVSVVVMGQAMRGKAQAVWANDLYVELLPVSSPGGRRHPGRAATHPPAQYVCHSGY